MDNLKKIVISCGGTGGHFYPGLSIARRFMELGGTPLLMLSGVNVEKQTQIARGFEIPVLPLPPMPSPNRPGKIFQFIKGAATGYCKAVKTMKAFEPQAFIGMGSFTSLPTVSAAKRLNVPVFLHDGNARAGRANRIFSRWAKEMFSAFPLVNQNCVKCPATVSGMPLRPEVVMRKMSKNDANEALKQIYNWHLNNNFTILVMGGSQGARTINNAVAEAAQICRGKLNIIHLCGEKLYRETGEKYKSLNLGEGDGIFLLPFSPHMGELYSVCDMIIGRSGGSSVAELLSFGRFGVLIPYPFAAELHQNDNAQFAQQCGAAEVIDNSNVSGAEFQKLFESIIANPEKYRQMGRNAQTDIHRNAADFILRKIDEVIAG